MSQEHDQSFQAAFDQVDEASWHEVMAGFTETNLYQTWSYGAVRWGDGQLSHCVLTRDSAVVGAAQLRIVRLPLLGGIAYLTSGPMWKRGDAATDLENLRHLLVALRREYVERRGLLLRIIPHEFGNTESLRAAYAEAGLAWSATGVQTAAVDLLPDADIRRKGLASRWRTDLNQSERNGLTIIEGTSDDLFGRFIEIFRSMHEAKQFDEVWDIEDFRHMQPRLPDSHKMTIMLCCDGDEAIAGAVTSVFGRFGLAMFWATNQAGREKKAAFLLQWHLSNWLRERGCDLYDTGGVDQEANPGSYRFKMGLAGKDAVPMEFIGQFEACRNPLSIVTVKGGEFAQARVKRLKARRA